MTTNKTLAVLSGCALALCSFGAAAQQTLARKWELVVDGAAHSTDNWAAMSADGFGNLYLTGNTRAVERSYYYDGIETRTVKVDKFGVVQWSAAHAGAGLLGAEGMAIDNDARGNVLVAANDHLSSSVAPYSQSALIKYDAAGLLQWVQNYPNLVAKAVKVNAAGAAYIAGVLPGAGVNECIVVKYSTAGAVEWERRLPGTTSDGTAIPVALALTRDGGAAFSCGTRINGGIVGQQTALYGPGGALVWQARHEDPARQSTSKLMQIDDSGNVVVAGQSNFSDFLLTKWSPTGVKLWSVIYDGGQAKSDDVNDLTLDNAGDVFVTGSVNGMGVLFTQVGTLKLSGVNGNIQWANAYGTGSYNVGKSVRVDGSGNALVLAMNSTSQVLLKYNAAGGLSWVDITPAGTRQLIAGPAMSTAIALDAGGCFVIGGNSQSPQVGAYANYDLALIKYCLGAQNCY